MRGQLHAGQLRYHDFAKLREAHAARQQRQQAQNQQRRSFVANTLGSNTPIGTINSLPPPSALARVLGTSAIPLSNGADGGILNSGSRTFLTASLANKMSDFRLKQMERVANHNPTNPTIQYEFLSELSRRYPEAVVERFEAYPDFAVDERCALLYFGALQRLNSYNRFDLRGFVRRMQTGGGAVHPVIMQALQDLVDNKSASSQKKMTKTMQATAAMQIVAGAGPSTALSGGSVGGGGGAMLGGGAASIMSTRGSDPKNPIFVQTHNPSSTRVALFTLARHVLIAFVVVSALTAVLDEKGMGRAMGMNGKHIQEAEGSDVKFEDVKGCDEAKAELEEIVMYLKNPERFTRLGGKLPRGLLLTGPPGTGKTLLAKAIAGEANVPFFFSSGSQFEEVYVGLGAKRVRELFEAAKKKSPAIIFIDEIDAVGGTRKLKDQSALKMTLNELLVQLDGFDENNGIIVIGATNFMESLDSALLRPGRFDKHVAVPLPDVGGRKEILEMYSKKTKLSKDVDLNVLARGTTGFSGADLYNLMNQAALKASVDGLNSITMAVFEYAKDKIIMGAERKTAVITAKTAKCTAYHEAGHALVATLTEGAQPIHKATIMPRGSALGMVTMLPEGDQTSQSLKEMYAYMDVAMGGRVAEELVFGADNVTSGAMSDIKHASDIARAMVTKYGFSKEVGIVFHGGSTGEESASGTTRGKIDEEVKKLTDESYERATALLKKHKKEHNLLAETLLEYETLTGEEVRDLILKGKKPNRPIINKEGGTRGDTSVLSTDDRAKPRLPGMGGKVGTRRDAKDM